MKSAALIILFTLLTSCANIPTREEFFTGEPSHAGRAGAGKMRIVAIDVGQGDSTLIISPEGKSMLIDTGTYFAGKHDVLPTLEEEGVGELKYILITHYHSDHVGGLPAIIMGPDEFDDGDDFQPSGGIYDRGSPQSIIDDPSHAIYALAHDGHRKTAHPGDNIDLGSVNLEVVAANCIIPDEGSIAKIECDDENGASVAVVVEYSGFRMFIGGDITGGGGEPPYDTPDIESDLAEFVGDIDILKVSHHGSKTSSNQIFIDGTTPEVAIISVGENDYGHPHTSVIDRLLNAGIEIYQTGTGALENDGPIVADGNITIEVDGDGEYEISY